MNHKTERENELVKLHLKKSSTEERQAIFAELVAGGADPDALSDRIANKVAATRRQRQHRMLKSLFTTMLVTVPVLVILLFLFVPPMKETTRAAVAAWLASPTPTGTVPGTPTPDDVTPTPTVTVTPTPTIAEPDPAVWTFTGRITRYGTDEGLANTQVSLQVRLSEGQEEIIPVTIDDVGGFVAEFESIATVEEAIARITLPTDSWQIRPPADSVWVQDSANPTLFSTTVTGTELPPLALEAVIDRRFSGQVALSTSPAGTDAAGVPGIRLGIEESVDGQNWQAVSCRQTPDAQMELLLDQQGNFNLTCESGNEQAYYRLRPALPAMYQVNALNVPALQGWSIDAMGWVTNAALPAGEFPGLSLLYQLQSITLLATCTDCLELAPDSTSWTLGNYINQDEEGSEYDAYIAFITTNNAQSLNATWTTFLPAGDYYLEIWTPDGMSTPVRYEVEMTAGTAGNSEFEGIYISNQQNREGVWWDFVATTVQPAYPISSVGEIIRVFVTPYTTNASFPYDQTTMAIGPIRLIVGSIPGTAATATATPIAEPTVEVTAEPPAESETPTSEPSPTP